jgi:hypothetical protein
MNAIEQLRRLVEERKQPGAGFALALLDVNWDALFAEVEGLVEQNEAQRKLLSDISVFDTKWSQYIRPLLLPK